jgi:hypothetical protein
MPNYELAFGNLTSVGRYFVNQNTNNNWEDNHARHGVHFLSTKIPAIFFAHCRGTAVQEEVGRIERVESQ